MGIMAYIGLRQVSLIWKRQILLTIVITKNINKKDNINNFDDLSKACCVLLACVCPQYINYSSNYM